jgi:hypothetical protein
MPVMRKLKNAFYGALTVLAAAPAGGPGASPTVSTTAPKDLVELDYSPSEEMRLPLVPEDIQSHGIVGNTADGSVYKITAVLPDGFKGKRPADNQVLARHVDFNKLIYFEGKTGKAPTSDIEEQISSLPKAEAARAQKAFDAYKAHILNNPPIPLPKLLPKLPLVPPPAPPSHSMPKPPSSRPKIGGGVYVLNA